MRSISASDSDSYTGICTAVIALAARGDAGALNRFRDGGACSETDVDFDHRAGQRVDDGDIDLPHAA